ncbi:MAG: aspartate carbamoyltransferase catalytic subunit [Verrucomicrobiota bacterium]
MKPRKDLLDLQSLSREELEEFLESTSPFKDTFTTRSIKKVPHLAGRTALLLFYEPSTRTSTSFDVAAKRMGADVVTLPVSHSSVVKGESILDTVETLEAMRTDYIVVRHQRSGVPNFIARNTQASVINAGDGFHAHPTQGLLDAFTLHEVWGGAFEGKRVLISGDVVHSRVARSTSTALRKLGATVGVLGPGSLVPKGMMASQEIFGSWEEALAWHPDAVYLLRIQLERQEEQFLPSLAEYHHVFGLTSERLSVLRERGVWVMHPGPINRGVELVNEVTEYERCLIEKQVENGVAARMAVLYFLRPGGEGRTGA